MPRLLWCMLLLMSFLASKAQALPSFSRQTGMSCVDCHAGFPVLTEEGRMFKIGGYTKTDALEKSNFPPLSLMLQPSLTHTDKSQPGGAAAHVGKNDNVALSAVSLFYSGRLLPAGLTAGMDSDAAAFLNKFGAFTQATYDGGARQFHWDNVEFRYADKARWFGTPTTYGLYVNNNPSFSDPWNTLPAWTFPFSSSVVAPKPAAATLLDGGFAQQVLGLGGYAFLNNTIYLDVAGYRTLGRRFQRAMGVDPNENALISGIAPYWRLAYTKKIRNSSFEAGIFGLHGSTHPGRDTSSETDRTRDIGFDAQYQFSKGVAELNVFFSRIQERTIENASEALGGSANHTNHLHSTKLGFDYLHDKTIGGTVGLFRVDGSTDATLYADNLTGSPKSDGAFFQVNYHPFAKRGGLPGMPNSDVKVSLKYVMYSHFNGARENYDGSGRNAKDNNTLYLETWFNF